MCDVDRLTFADSLKSVLIWSKSEKLIMNEKRKKEGKGEIEIKRKRERETERKGERERERERKKERERKIRKGDKGVKCLSRIKGFFKWMFLLWLAFQNTNYKLNTIHIGLLMIIGSHN
jgi:hypothetical protein